MQKDIIQPEGWGYLHRLKSFSNLWVLISFIVILLLTYSPTVQIHYEYMEDYGFINSYREHSLLGEIETWSGSGLSVYGIWTYVISSYAKSAIFVRLLSVIGLGLLAYLIYTILRMYRVKTEHAFLISILVCTLPSFQIITAWLSCAPYLYSAILSVIAGLLSLKVVSNKITLRSIPVASFLIIIFILVIALHMYQPSAMIYFAVCIIPLSLLKDEDFIEKWHMRFIIYIALGLISIAVYFFSVKVLHFVMNIGFVGRGEFIKLTNIPLKLKWFFFCPLNFALNLWNSLPTYKLASIVGIIIIWFFLSQILQVLKKEKKMDLLWNHCQRLLFITGILFLCYLPHLMVTDTIPVYRTLASLTTAICFLLYFGFVNILDFFKFIPGFSTDLKDKTVTISLIILALITAYHAHNKVNDFANLHANEFKYVKTAISAEYNISKLSGISEVYVRRHDRNKIIESGYIYEEFGLPTTAFPNYGPPTVIRKAFHELGMLDLVRLNGKISITEGDSDTPVPTGENILVIDMTKLDYLNDNSFITNAQRYCLTIPTRL